MKWIYFLSGRDRFLFQINDKYIIYHPSRMIFLFNYYSNVINFCSIIRKRSFQVNVPLLKFQTRLSYLISYPCLSFVFSYTAQWRMKERRKEWKKERKKYDYLSLDINVPFHFPTTNILSPFFKTIDRISFRFIYTSTYKSTCIYYMDSIHIDSWELEKPLR